jgi:integrase
MPNVVPFPKHERKRRRKGTNLVFFSVQKLDALKPEEGRRRSDFFDRGIRGFGIRVFANGLKTFTVRYTLHGKQQRRWIGIYRNPRGAVGGEITFSEARAEAERIISEARNGRDPFLSEALLRRADISSFEGVCERFLADPAPGRRGRPLSQATRQGLVRIVRKELVPAWGRRDPNSIQRQEIQLWARGIAYGKDRKKPAPYLANRAADYMAMIYSWAVRREILRYTPFLGFEKPFEEQPRTRSFSNDEIRRLIAALAQAPKQVAAVWLMLLYTGNRLRETLRLEWAWIDFEKKHLVLPATVTKNRRPHLVPLVQGPVELLEMIRGLDPKSPYVFPGPDGKPLRWMQRASEAVLSNAGIEDGRHHDTRRILQTNMAELGVAPHVADMILNHAVKGAPRSRAHYDMYHYIPEKRDALTRWTQRLTEIVGHDPNTVTKAERRGYQGKGAARRLDRVETYAERKARLAAQGRDLNAERRAARAARQVRVRPSDDQPGDVTSLAPVATPR